MSIRANVLEAMLESISTDLPKLACIDLTDDGIGAQLLGPRRARCDAKPELGPEGYHLVICEASTLEQGASLLHPDGSLLIFVANEQEEFADVASIGLRRAGRVRCTEGEWKLLARAQSSLSTTHFDISVVVTCQDNVAELGRMVTFLADEDVTFGWELVVVDRGSYDATAELLRHLDGDVRVVRMNRDLPEAAAQREASESASGNVLAFVDVNASLARGWLQVLHDAVEQHADIDWFVDTEPATADNDTPQMFAVRAATVPTLNPATVLGAVAQERKTRKSRCVPLAGIIANVGSMTLAPSG